MEVNEKLDQKGFSIGSLQWTKNYKLYVPLIEKKENYRNSNTPLQRSLFTVTKDAIIGELGSENSCQIFRTDISLLRYGDM